jgi:dephospho-CoA kinase
VILRVGLTGGIASGKSTIARMLGEMGCAVVDADAIVSRLYRPGVAGHKAVFEAYGDPILLPGGEIDRAKLAAIAFATPDEARRLNALIHPLVIAEEAAVLRNLEPNAPPEGRIAVVEATLLLESGGRERYEKIVVVDVAPEVQIERALARGMSREDVARRIGHQMSRAERLRYADYVIDNSGDLERAVAETCRVHGQLRADLAAKIRK